MKVFIILATFVALGSSRTFLPCNNRPEPIHPLPPSVDPIHPITPEVDPIHPGKPEVDPIHPGKPEVDPIHPSRPEVDPIHPNLPEVDPIYPERPLPPGVLPEIPIVPEKPELPAPLPPFIGHDVESHVLNFPSDEDPQIRVHVNIKKDQFPSHRPVRSIFDSFWPSKPALPEIGNKPELPEIGNKPEIPSGNFPILPPLPEISFPTPGVEVNPGNDGISTFVYPNAQYQLVKLRVVYNKPSITPFKLEFPEAGNKPALPEIGNKPELPEIGNKPEIPIINLPEVEPEKPINPMPMPPVNPKVPQVELFLDIGEQEQY
ncbi:uncharacterized protein LOC134828505 [Culicoides brevitarsis]|uniref:uncharacterized protein LOC134828505 n=1 Tax=Culicoides brevitarsis TaxID=469753 RepID=UPI00307BE993